MANRASAICIAECAYEHWHRMLFARFLAECGLLIEPTSGVPVSVEECKEFARESGVDWISLASAFAQGMLPQIFRADDAVLEIALPAEHRQPLEKLLVSLPTEVFLADDSLGWCYQFWQAERKDEVNAAGNKIGADELPAVTQLFTEDYMVDFLLDNTLGAWHAGKVLAAKPELAETAQSEEELRNAVGATRMSVEVFALHQEPGRQVDARRRHVRRLAEDGEGTQVPRPVHGQRAFRCGDVRAACGAADGRGRGWTKRTAVAAVIRDNLFGLEIDPRCTQIGAFNLALAAWRRVGPLHASGDEPRLLWPRAERKEG